MMNVLFPVLSGTYEKHMYGLADDLVRLSSGDLKPCMLWMTEASRTQHRTYPEDVLRNVMKQYRIPKAYEEAYYHALRYKNINLMDAIRINMIDTPDVPVERLLRWAIRYLYAIEKYLDVCDFDAVVFLLGRGLFQRCLGIMARQKNIRTFYLCDGFIPGPTTHIWHKDMEDLTDDLKGLPLPPLNDTQKQELAAFIQKMKQVKNVAVSPYEMSGFYKKIISFLYLLFRNDNLKGNRSIWFFFKNEWLRMFRRFMVRRYYTKGLPDRYVFLPFIVTYDFQYALLWAEYANEEYLVDVVRRNLPDGYTLVVKEHPHLSGAVPSRSMKRISRMQNVMIAPINMDPNLILQNSSAVVTFCSSVGWQALLHGKTVVTLRSRSHPEYTYFYADYKMTIDVDENQLGMALQKAVQNGSVPSKVDSFLYHVILDRMNGSPKICPVLYTDMLKGDNISVVGKYLWEKMTE